MPRILIILFFLFSMQVIGQNSYYLEFISPSDQFHHDKKLKKFNEKEKITAFIEKKHRNLIKKGHVLASIDSVEYSEDTMKVALYQGPAFKQITINFDEKDHYIIRKTPRISERLIAKLPFQPELVEQLLTSVSSYLNQNGYPFSKVYLKIEDIHPDHSYAHLHIEKGPLTKITKINIRGESKVKEKFVQNAISLKEGDLYNSSAIQNISNKLSQVQFISEMRPHEILFTPEGAELFLYLESSPVSSINGIVGLQPNPVTQKTTVTGEVQLRLQNIIKNGEGLRINWRSLQPKTQELNIDFDFPFLFNTPFGIDAKFDLYKLDSTYLETDFQVGVRYYFSGGSYLKAFYQNESSNLLYGAAQITNSNLATVKTHNYGLGYHRFKVDYLPNPSRGLNITTNISIGQRKSTSVEIDSITASSITMRGDLNIEAYIPITRRNVIRLANSTRSYFAPTIFQNELFRFGGLKTQRGFNEETMNATTLTTFTIEYRFLVDKNSHAFAFFDQTIYENNSREYTRDTPFGFGVGYSFGTRLGIFSISYALGKQFDNPIHIRDGKVHFGYIAYF